MRVRKAWPWRSRPQSTARCANARTPARAVSARSLHHRHRILQWSRTAAARLDIALRCGRAHGRISALLPGDQMAAIELGRDLHRQAALAQRRRRELGVRRRREKLPPIATNTSMSPAVRMARIVSTVSSPYSRGGENRELVRPGGRETPPASSRKCPWCGRPARCCGRAPGTRRRRACRYRRASASGSRSPECWPTALLVLRQSHGPAEMIAALRMRSHLRARARSARATARSRSTMSSQRRSSAA